ncbi:hypothetical protein BV898_19498 [Hypsibius exemplaris]|uniref:Uncharacterized protein n=1 Tax=Hypsibius exemplaris TaxID=2072580 RepID=A0A9X6RP03_HYPEX|nr:hypothetical protein BV898_19498 [Hypsibius exemplaris]
MRPTPQPITQLPQEEPGDDTSCDKIPYHTKPTRPNNTSSSSPTPTTTDDQTQTETPRPPPPTTPHQNHPPETHPPNKTPIATIELLS